MEATLTSKGQLTLPKPIRDRLGLEAGARLSFALQPDGTIHVRAVVMDPLAVSDVLPPPKRRKVPDAALHEATAEGATQRFLRSTRSR